MERFLLHCCCAPCGIAVIDELRRLFELTVFFYNPNIYPQEEYRKRKREVIRVCKEWEVVILDGDYEPERWTEAVRGKEKSPEGGPRCAACITLRLEKTASVAAERAYPVFGTTLTMGRQKKSSLIFPIGERAGERAGVRFYAEDWKKRGREDKARVMIAERGIYRQNYCGCVYSLERRLDLD